MTIRAGFSTHISTASRIFQSEEERLDPHIHITVDFYLSQTLLDALSDAKRNKETRRCGWI